MVISAIRACMQSHGLPEALRTGLDRFCLADLRARDLPDVRLDMLIEDDQELGRSISHDIADQLEPADREAALRWLTSQPDDPAGSGHKNEEAFLVARSAGTLRAQHAITDELRPLPLADTAPVVAIRTPAGTPEAPALRLWQVARPRELRAMRSQIGGLGVVSSVSMSLLADTPWESRWLEPLLECGPVTILMDLNPFVHYEH